MLMPTLTADVLVGLACRQQPCLSKSQLVLCITALLTPSHPAFLAVLSASLLFQGWSLAWPIKLPPYHPAQGFLSDVFTLCFVQHHRTRPGQGIEPIFMLLPNPTNSDNNVEAEAGLSTTLILQWEFSSY